MGDDGASLADDLEDLWSDYGRSLVRRNKSPQTAAVYRKAFDNFWRWAARENLADPGAVDYRIVNRWCDALTTTVATRNQRAILVTDPTTGTRVPKLLEPSTRRLLFRNLRPFFTWYAREFETTNPFDRADAPGDDRARPVPVVALDDLRALLAACVGRSFLDRRDHAVISVMLDTGARLGEVVSLRREDWNRRADLLTLRGKTGSREAVLGAATGESLARYDRERKLHSHSTRPALWLAAKGPLTASGVAQLLKARCEQGGVAPINPHRLRHTWAHEYRAHGGSEGDLVVLAGWSSLEMARRYGASAAADRAKRAGCEHSLGDRL